MITNKLQFLENTIKKKRKKGNPENAKIDEHKMNDMKNSNVMLLNEKKKREGRSRRDMVNRISKDIGH